MSFQIYKRGCRLMGLNKGIVKFYKTDKGFGFLETDRGSVFFHISEVNDGVPEPGMLVSCDIISTTKGLQAKNIQLMVSKTGGKFIRIGEDRIKVSNIKNYHIINEKSAIEVAKNKLISTERYVSKALSQNGISSSNGTSLPISSERNSRYTSSLKSWLLHTPTRSELQEELREAQQELQKLYDSYDIELSKNPKILHITTYQNDNYWYTDIKNYSGEYNYLNRNDDLVFGIDVDAIVEELDKLLT